MKKVIIVISSLIIPFLTGCKNNEDVKALVSKVLSNVVQIKSSTYLSSISASAPGDTAKFVSYDWLNKELINPADSFIGSTFAWFEPEDSSKMYYFYDGIAQGYIDRKSKTIEIDSFNTGSLAFRPIGPPFFNYIKSILEYTLHTRDSIVTSVKYNRDTIIFSLTITGNKQVEFFGSPVYLKNPYSAGEEISRYDIWINKSDYLPFKYRRKMSTNTSWEICKNVRFNSVNAEDLKPAQYFPVDYTISVRGKEKPFVDNLTGTHAPDWTLSDSDHRLIALNALKSKVLLIQFTGIGCGPCHASIPLLKQLVTDYKNKSFELICIETWSNNHEGIKRYCSINNIPCKFLLSTKEITENYQIRGVPAFFILDENRIIRKIIRGYSKETTDKEIIEAINKLI